MEDIGEGRGAGYNINVPLPPGSGHGAYLETMTAVVVPALQAYRPELIVVASGLDASTMDPLARMMCYSETYRQMTRMLKRAAEELCDGKLVLCHEGGYSSVEQCAVVRARHPRRAFRKIATSFRDPSVDRSGMALPGASASSDGSHRPGCRFGLPHPAALARPTQKGRPDQSGLVLECPNTRTQ